MVEVNVVGGEEALHVVLSMEDGLFAVYQDPDWSYAIREGEALAAAVRDYPNVAVSDRLRTVLAFATLR